MSFRKRPDLRPVSRFLKSIPLWERPAFRYPIYRPGNPQTRLFLPQFWMKIMRDERNKSPPNSVQFEVHREMTKHDIREYLEKIYEVKVLKIRTYTIEVADDEVRGFKRALLVGVHYYLVKSTGKALVKKDNCWSVAPGKDAFDRATDEPWLRTTFTTTDFDRKFAFVTLKDSTFYFPDIAQGYRSKQNKEEEAEKKIVMKKEAESSKTLGIPKFFLQ